MDNNWSLRVTSHPTMEPVTLYEVKSHLRVPHDLDEEDTLIVSQMQAAREYCEKYQGTAFMEQSFLLVFDSIPSSPIELPRPPLNSVQRIQFRDKDGDLEEWDNTNYFVDVDFVPGRVIFLESPPTDIFTASVCHIDYTAGYATPEDVPEAYKAAIKLLVGHLYDNREAVIVGARIPREMLMAVEALLGQDRMVPI